MNTIIKLIIAIISTLTITNVVLCGKSDKKEVINNKD